MSEKRILDNWHRFKKVSRDNIGLNNYSNSEGD